MFDVITFGSATRDVFAASRDFKIVKVPSFPTGKALAVPLGSKMDLHDFHFTIGGGAVNTAATFAKQGLKVGAVCVVGKDPGGEQVRQFFQESNISRDFLFVDAHEKTAYSLILSAWQQDRTILQYNGAEWHLHEFQLPFAKLSKATWWYVNHVGGKAAPLVPKILRTAAQKGVKIAWNPGKTQLQLKARIRPLLKNVDLFIVNQQEASFLTGVPYAKRNEMFGVLDRWVKGIVIMTRGPKGVEVSDGKTRWSAGVLPLKTMCDRTGAGDAFGSGFVASFLKHPEDIERAIQLASANATGVLTEWGTTNGLLKRTDSLEKWGRLKMRKRKV